MRNFVTLMCPHLAAKHIGVDPEEEIGSLRLLIFGAKNLTLEAFLHLLFG